MRTIVAFSWQSNSMLYYAVNLMQRSLQQFFLIKSNKFTYSELEEQYYPCDHGFKAPFRAIFVFGHDRIKA